MLTNIPSNAVLSFMIMNDESGEKHFERRVENVNIKVKRMAKDFLNENVLLFAVIKQCLKHKISIMQIQIRLFNKIMKSPKRSYKLMH